MEWFVWIAIGIVCIIIEIFTPGFIFFSFGLSSILTGLFALLSSNLILQIITFCILMIIVFINMKRFAKKVLHNKNIESNVFAIKGKKGVVTKVITQHQHGYVKLAGEEWSALLADGNLNPILEGTDIIVVSTEGNKVFVEPISKEE